MNLSEYNQTKEQIENMIFSNDTDNCIIACEILKGLEMDSLMKYDWIIPIVKSFITMVEGCLKIGSDVSLDKASDLLKKIDVLNETADICLDDC